MSVGGGIPGSSGPRRFLRRREQQRVTHTTTVSTAAPTVTTPAATHAGTDNAADSAALGIRSRHQWPFLFRNVDQRDVQLVWPIFY